MGEFKRICRLKKGDYSLGLLLTMPIFIGTAAVAVITWDGIKSLKLPLLPGAICGIVGITILVKLINSDKRLREMMASLGASDESQCDALLDKMFKFDDYVYLDADHFINFENRIIINAEDVYTIYSERKSGGSDSSPSYCAKIKLCDGSEVSFKWGKWSYDINRLISIMENYIN